jgi:cytochrome oxidase assembly protein ShyY1
MGSFRFLLSRRWSLFALAIVVVAGATWWLGRWQFSRLEERHAKNDTVAANAHHDPVPVEDVLEVGRPVPADREWTLVTATGVYDDTVITWRYRSGKDGSGRDDVPGIDTVIPLRTTDGTMLLVDRGFIALPTNAELDYDPFGGQRDREVTVTGYVRADGTGSSTALDDAWGTRALSSKVYADKTGEPTYGGWVHLASETPEPTSYLELSGPPEPSNGPHFFYGLQWWFFGVLALFGFGYLLFDEWRSQGERTPRAERALSEKARRRQELKAAYRAAYEKERSGE